MERPQGGLDREREEEAEEEHLLRVGVHLQAHQGQEVESSAPQFTSGDHIQADQRRQHEQAAEQAVEEELDCRVGPLRTAVTPNHEVDRDQHHFEEDVEQEDIRRSEDADHQRFEGQDQREVTLDRTLGLLVAFDIAPTRQNHDGNQRCGQRDQHQSYPVHSYRVRDAERRDPGVGLHELEGLRGCPVELQGHRDRQCQDGTGDHERDLLGQRRLGLRKKGDHDAADQGQQAEGRQPGEGAHDSTTKTSAMATMRAPPTMDNA